uniref:Uncharacterized protein n=1 Tax=Meloidogyne enterolobii TaxID=390850 RepID=A0A6V7WZF9_MELEN|nr:unnamed protein product [Meloidogyne enterolobii]
MNFIKTKIYEFFAQIFQELIEENNQKLKAENDAYLKQKDEKIKFLEEEIKTVLGKVLM